MPTADIRSLFSSDPELGGQQLGHGYTPDSGNELKVRQRPLAVPGKPVAYITVTSSGPLRQRQGAFSAKAHLRADVPVGDFSDLGLL